MVFDKQWFHKHQKVLRWLANTKVGRHIFRINKNSSVGKNKIALIEPNAIYWVNEVTKEKAALTAEFRTHDKYSKRLYHAFYPIWWTMHFLDWLVFDRFEWAHRWNFGFLTLTEFCGSGSGGTTVDGTITAANATWATAQGATTGTVDKTSASGYIARASLVTGTYHIFRGFFTWNTAALTSAAIISSVVASFFDTGGGDDSNTDATSLDIVQSTQASNNDLVANDYDNVGTTSFFNIALGSWTASSSYHNCTLNANGIANISKTGVSKYAVRINRDLANSAPTGSNQRSIFYGDQSGTTNDPKLVVTYTIPSGVSGSNLALMGAGF